MPMIVGFSVKNDDDFGMLEFIKRNKTKMFETCHKTGENTDGKSFGNSTAKMKEKQKERCNQVGGGGEKKNSSRFKTKTKKRES
jgi:hypothetical protein